MSHWFVPLYWMIRTTAAKRPTPNISAGRSPILLATDVQSKLKDFIRSISRPDELRQPKTRRSVALTFFQNNGSTLHNFGLKPLKVPIEFINWLRWITSRSVILQSFIAGDVTPREKFLTTNLLAICLRANFVQRRVLRFWLIKFRVFYWLVRDTSPVLTGKQGEEGYDVNSARRTALV